MRSPTPSRLTLLFYLSVAWQTPELGTAVGFWSKLSYDRHRRCASSYVSLRHVRRVLQLAEEEQSCRKRCSQIQLEVDALENVYRRSLPLVSITSAAWQRSGKARYCQSRGLHTALLA